MRLRNLVLATSAALAFAASAVAASAAKDPSTLILQKKDFAAGADYDWSSGDDFDLTSALGAKGVAAKAATFLGATYSKRAGFLQVSGIVFTTAGAAKARIGFGIVTKERQAFWKRLRAGYKPIARIPSFGDQQLALYDAPGGEGIASIDLIVRKSSVIWLLNVKLERRPPPPMSEIVAALKTYAAKQKARVGAGR